MTDFKSYFLMAQLLIFYFLLNYYETHMNI